MLTKEAIGFRFDFSGRPSKNSRRRPEWLNDLEKKHWMSRLESQWYFETGSQAPIEAG